MIYPLSGCDFGVLRSDNHAVCEWRGKGRVVFSFAQKGKGMDCHFATDSKGLREVKQAISDFVEWVFNRFEWCTMIFAAVIPPSVERIVRKCGFEYLVPGKQESRIYVRLK